jgi:hypothetical protein
MNEVSAAEHDAVTTGNGDSRDGSASTPPHPRELSPLDGRADRGTDDRRGATNRRTGESDQAQADNHRGGCSDADYCTAMAASELIPVTPRGELWPQRLSDADQLESLGKSRETDVFRGHAFVRVAKQPLAILDRFPTFLEWGEIPPLARLAHHPEPAAPLIEGQPSPHWERLDDFIRAQRVITKQAR